jgi:hypothetical protein
MVWQFAQVWVLCTISFLAGAGVTWLLFGRQPRRVPPPRTTAGPTGVAHWAADPWADRRTEPSTPAPPPSSPPSPGPPVEPALSNLDTRGTAPPPRPAGAAAANALDMLGVAGTPVPQPTDRPEDTDSTAAGSDRPIPRIPSQGGPVDSPRQPPTERE